MKKKIFFGIIVGLWLVPSMVFADACTSKSCPDPSATCDYSEGVNNSCHYECTETSTLNIPGPILGSDGRGIPAGTGFDFPFTVSTNYECELIMHPEPIPPEPKVPPKPNPSNYYHTECDTCCSSCPDPCDDWYYAEGDQSCWEDNPDYEPCEDDDECGNPNTGAGASCNGEKVPPRCNQSNLFIEPPSAKPLIGTGIEIKPTQVDNCECGSYSCNCRQIFEAARYNADVAAYEAAVEAHKQWEEEKARIEAEIAHCESLSDYAGSMTTTNPSQVSMTIEEKQPGKVLGHTYTFGELEYTGAFTIKAPWIKRYTGEIIYATSTIDFYESAYYYRGKNYYYTDVMTQPGCFDIDVHAINIGQNCSVNLDTSCYYKVRNKYYCVTEDCESEGTGKGIQYIFRPIDLNDVFPNDRGPRWNWSCSATNTWDKYYPIAPVYLTEKIEEKGYNIYGTSDSEYDASNDLDYEITLTPTVMRKVRQYNRSQGSYLNYDDYCYRDDKGKTVCSSNFLHGEIQKYGDNVLNKSGLIGCNNQKDSTTCDTYFNIDSCYTYFRSNGWSEEDCRKIVHEVYID